MVEGRLDRLNELRSGEILILENDQLEITLEILQRITVGGRHLLGRNARHVGHDLLDVRFVQLVPAFVLGLSALGDMRRDGSRRLLKGKAMAITGAALAPGSD